MGFFDRGVQAVRTGVRERLVEPRALSAAERRCPDVRPPSAALEPMALEAAELDASAAGRSERGEEILAGRFLFAGRLVEAKPDALWRVSPPTEAWAEAAHRFDWLPDLEALGGAAGRAAAWTLARGWLDRRRRYDTVAWATDVAAQRLWTLLGSTLPTTGAGPEAATDQESRDAERIRKSVAAHVLWLERRWPEAAPGVEAIRCAAALVRACLTMDGLEAHQRFALERLDEALSDGLSADGAPITRNPEHALEALEKLQILRECFARPGSATAPLRAPDSLRVAGPRLAAAVRFFRRGDGGLPLFHGARAGAEGRLEAALTRARLPDLAPAALIESGYQRFAGGRVSTIMDVGGRGVGPEPHLSPLAIEMTSGRRRLIVSCGSAAHLDAPAEAPWRAAARGLTGHSTVSVALDPTELTAFNAAPVTADRRSERNGEWLFGAHDGFAPSCGLRISRRMFLTADGGDFRGEDVVELAPDGMPRFEKRLARLPRRDRAAGLPWLVRFHLHPEVDAELVADGEAVSLKLAHGENWVMRQAGGRLSVEESFYLDRPGRPQPSAQIVVRAQVAGEKTFVRWAFRRVGELGQQPKDVDALLVAGRAESDAVEPAPLGGFGAPPFSG